MSHDKMDPQDMTAAEVACLDDAEGISGKREALDLDEVTIQYDPSSETLEDTQGAATA